MNKVFLVVFILELVVSTDVVSLTVDNFDSVVNSADSGIWFVRFFAPWCKHCKRMIPAWETSATNLKGLVGVANVDGTVERELMQRYNVHFYPSLFLFTNRKVYEYNGDRESSSLTSFAKTAKEDIESGRVPSGCSFYMNVETIGGRNTTLVPVKGGRSFNWVLLLLLLFVIICWFFGWQMISAYVSLDTHIDTEFEELSILETGHHGKDLCCVY